MALRSLSSTRQQTVGPRDSPPTEGGSGTGARADVARKTKEAENLYANLKLEGVEIDEKMATIIDDEIARIKAEADRKKKINGLKKNVAMVGKMFIFDE